MSPGWSKAFFASRWLLRRYSYPVPWNALLPLLSTTLICAPELRPNSAEYVPVCTLNSWIASTDGSALY